MEPTEFSWRRELPYALIPAVAAMGVRAACLPYIEAAWDADGANSCLMALHHSWGWMPIYWYSQDYNGSLEALLAAPFVYAMGPTVQAMGVAMTLLAGVLTVLLYRVGHELGGRAGAMLGCAVYAACSLPLVDNLSGINHSYTMMLVLGVLILLAGRRFLEEPTRGRTLTLGFLVGLTLFNNPQGVSFVAPIAFALWLRGRSIPRLLGRDGAARTLWPRAILATLLVALAVTIGMSATETTALDLGAMTVSLSKPGRYIMRLVLGIALFFGVMELLLGERRRLLRVGAVGALGVAIGLAPAFVFKLTKPADEPVKSSPAGLDPTFTPHHIQRLWTEQAGELYFTQLPYGHFGRPPHSHAPDFPEGLHRIARGAGGVLLLAMIAGALVVRRKDWWEVLALRPPPNLDLGWLLAAHGGAALVLYLMFPRHDVYPKYLQATLVPAAGLVAASFAYVAARQRALALAGAVLWLVVAGFTAARSVAEVHGRWSNPKHEWHEVREILDEIRKREGVKNGFANYWFGWKINYLSAEEIVLREWPRVPACGLEGQRPMIARYHKRVDDAVGKGEPFVFLLAAKKKPTDEDQNIGFGEDGARVWFERRWRDSGRYEVYDAVETETYSLYFCRKKQD